MFRGFLVLFLGLTFGCTTLSPEDLKVAPGLQTMVPQEANSRTLAHLDVNSDQELNDKDVKLFSELYQAAQAEADSRSLDCSAGGVLYEGAKDGTPVFAKLQKDKSGDFTLEGLSNEELRELTIESRWLTLQVRQAVAGNLAPGQATFGGSLAAKFSIAEKDDFTPVAFCEALARFEPKEIVGEGFVPTAVFDLDSTIWLGNVTDRFLAKLVEMKMPQAESNPALIEFLKTQANIDAKAVEANTALQNSQIILRRAMDKTLPKEQQVSPKDVFFNIIAMLKGLDVKVVRDVAREVYETGLREVPAWRHRVFSDESGCGMRQVVKTLQDKGVQVYVLSATLHILALEGARMLGIDEKFVQGSRLGKADGKYTGKLAEGTYYIKGEVVRQWLDTPPLLVFGDSASSDFSMLQEASVAGIMVNPSSRMLQRDAKETNGRLLGVVFATTEIDTETGRE